MRSRDQIVPNWITGAVIVTTFATLTGLELIRALRRRREPKPLHVARNLALAAIAGIATGLTERPVILPLARHGHDLLNAIPFRTLVAILWLDYTLYLWHVLTHRVPLLWRFHLAHHIDLDCDASTALRFHGGELLLSVPFRAAQIALLGVTAFEYTLWQTLLFACILFHHSNIDLSPVRDRRLSRFLVTPRMHGIHHDAVRANTDSNWSSGLSIWDRLHRTLNLDVPQPEVLIGVPAYQKPEDVTLARALVLPFVRHRDAWQPE